MANSTDDCLELMLNDIVEVRLIPATAFTMPVPVNVPQVTAMTLTLPSSSTLKLTLAGTSSADAQLTEEPSLKVTHSSKKSGVIYSFDISCSIDKGMDTVRGKVKTMKSDHYMAVRLADGTWMFCYILPNTFSASLDDSISTGTLKITGSSLSSVIQIQNS